MTKQVNHKELGMLINRAYTTKLPLFIWGTTGIGKSQTVREEAIKIAKREKLELSETDIENDKFGFVDVRISQLEPSDLRGLPKLDGETTVWLPPNWLPRNKNSKGIIFMDELNLAPPSIQASCYQLILDRKLGDYVLPDGWIIIGAGNRAEDRANVFDLPAPLKNRLLHAGLVVPNIKEWTNWATRNNLDGRVVSFLNFKSTMLFKFDPDGKDEAFPTPRSWEYCSTLIRGIDDNTLGLLASTAVGEGTALEFEAFNKLSKKINLNDILNNPEKVKSITDLSMKYSLLGGISDFYHRDKKNLDKIVKVCSHLEPEFAILLLRFVKNIDTQKFQKEVIKLGEWKEIGQKYGKYLL